MNKDKSTEDKCIWESSTDANGDSVFWPSCKNGKIYDKVHEKSYKFCPNCGRKKEIGTWRIEGVDYIR